MRPHAIVSRPREHQEEEIAGCLQKAEDQREYLHQTISDTYKTVDAIYAI
jgi:hypothetical protein